jgi:hypothetical protein
MATFSRSILSGSTNGLSIRVLGATTSGGVLVHSAYTDTGGSDEVWLYGYQYGTTSGQTVTVRFGGATLGDEIRVAMTPGSAGVIPVIPGLPINNSLEVRAFCTTSNEISLYGWVNRVAS